MKQPATTTTTAEACACVTPDLDQKDAAMAFEVAGLLLMHWYRNSNTASSLPKRWSRWGRDHHHHGSSSRSSSSSSRPGSPLTMAIPGGPATAHNPYHWHHEPSSMAWKEEVGTYVPEDVVTRREEDALVDRITGLLLDPAINAYNGVSVWLWFFVSLSVGASLPTGSVPLERLAHLLAPPGVRAMSGKQVLAVVQRRPDRFRLLCAPPLDADGLPGHRVCLYDNTEWKKADHIMQCDRQLASLDLCQALRRRLLTCETGRLSLDDFLQTHRPLWRRGDAVRAIRRSGDLAFDRRTYQVTWSSAN